MNVQIIRRAAIATVLILLVPLLARSQTPEAAARTDNQELKQLMLDEQHDRGNEPIVEYDEHGKRITPVKEWKQLPWDEINKRDALRRNRVRQMLDAGQIRTGQDYNFAALIFHHGELPEDYLLAHILALTAVAKGYKNARLLTAATLDRLLQSMNQPQVYGTQFLNDKNGGFTQGEYNRRLIPDSARADLCVIGTKQQEEQVRESKIPGKEPNANSGLVPCP